MNNERRLTWKYFWKQKWKEISFVLLLIFIIWSIAGVFFQLGWICEGAFEGDRTCIEPHEPSFPYWMMYSGFITTGIWIIIGLVHWIQTNWEKAKEKAKRESKNE